MQNRMNTKLCKNSTNEKQKQKQKLQKAGSNRAVGLIEIQFFSHGAMKKCYWKQMDSIENSEKRLIYISTKRKNTEIVD